MVESRCVRHRRIGIATIAAALLVSALAAMPVAAAPTSWRETPAPTVANTNVILGEVSCPAARLCVALTNTADLAERWNGARWKTMPGPRRSSDVSCPTPTMCVAVGGSANRPIADMWDGENWTASAPRKPGGSALLHGVACVSTTWCMATGSAHGTGFFERFDGTKWTLVAMPILPKVYTAGFSDVSCASDSSCVAVGSMRKCRRCGALAIAATWDGAGWTLTHAPASPGPSSSALSHVSCGAADRCLAIGFSQDESFDYPVVERWNGARWRLEPSPLPPDAAGSHTENVACARKFDCVVVGSWYGPDDGPPLFGEMIATFDGSAWSYPTIPTLTRGDLFGVDCFDARHCAAVGQDFSSSFYRPLAFVGTSP